MHSWKREKTSNSHLWRTGADLMVHDMISVGHSVQQDNIQTSWLCGFPCCLLINLLNSWNFAALLFVFYLLLALWTNCTLNSFSKHELRMSNTCNSIWCHILSMTYNDILRYIGTPFIQTWSELLAPLVNMIKEGCKNESALILLIFYLKNHKDLIFHSRIWI